MLAPCLHAKLLSHVWFFWNPMDCSPPGASVHGILQRSILEWVAMSSSRGSSQLKGWTQVSRAPVLQADSLLLCPLSGEAHTYSTDHCFCVTMQENAQKKCVKKGHSALTVAHEIVCWLCQHCLCLLLTPRTVCMCDHELWPPGHKQCFGYHKQTFPRANTSIPEIQLLWTYPISSNCHSSRCND